MNLDEIIGVPPSSDINSHVSPCHLDTMMDLIGAPGSLTRNCSDVTNKKLRAKIVTDSVGPLRVTGHKQAILSLKQIFAIVGTKRPDIYKAVQCDGMLCCRATRNKTSTSFSNHAWGLAIDLQFNELDDYGATHCRRGLLELYTYFHQAGWYWGAGFPHVDAMHFEPSDEKVREWSSKGLLI